MDSRSEDAVNVPSWIKLGCVNSNGKDDSGNVALCRFVRKCCKQLQTLLALAWKQPSKPLEESP
jgi:hypothetical protein